MLSLVAVTSDCSLAQASHCGGFSSCRAQTLGNAGFSRCGAQAYLPHGMWNLPGSGIKPMSPALAGILNHWTTREALKLRVTFYLACKTEDLSLG